MKVYQKTIAWVPKLLVAVPWPVPALAVDPIRVKHEGKHYLIGGHSAIEARAIKDVGPLNICAHTHHQHLACIIYSPCLSIERIRSMYSASHNNHQRLRLLLEELREIWVSSVDDDAVMEVSSPILQCEYVRLEQCNFGHNARRIDNAIQCRHFKNEELIRVDLDYLRGAAGGKKAYYFWLLSRVLSHDMEESRLTLEQAKLLLVGRAKISKHRFYQQTLRHLNGVVYVGEHTYGISACPTTYSVRAVKLEAPIRHALAEKARSSGIPESVIANIWADDTVPEWVSDRLYNMVRNVSELSIDAAWDLGPLLRRAYRGYVWSADGPLQQHADAFETRLHAICTAAAKLPTGDRPKYINGAIQRETLIALMDRLALQ